MDQTMTQITEFKGQYYFLSNFYWHSHLTNEHHYQAMKTFNPFEQIRVYEAKTPGMAKRLGRKVTLRPDWDNMRLEVMEHCLRLKFEGNDALGNLLIATGDAELIEGNDWNDTYWGVCRGKGENHLGELLMKIREDLRHG